MALPEAQPAEVLRAWQKDDLYKTKLTGYLSRLLSQRQQFLATPASSVLYSSFTTLKDLQTLGEEYSGIVQVDDSYNNLPSFTSRLLSIILSQFGENICRKILKQAERSVENNPTLTDKAKNAFIITTRGMSNMLGQFERVHRALCYIFGGPLQLGKAVTSIDYVQVRPAVVTQHAHLRLLGLVTLIHSLICCGKSWIQARDSITMLNDIASNTDSKNTCVACLSELKHPCVLPCGHIFCMQCCFVDLENCALCRMTFTKNTVVILQNYAPESL